MDQTQKDWQTQTFEWFAKRSPKIISFFHFFYYLGVFILIVVSLIEAKTSYFGLIYNLGKHLGQAAITLLGIIVLPGILGRLKIEIRVTRIITLFRRQLGITVFLLATSHYTLVHLVPTAVGVIDAKIPYPELFKNLGVIAFFILFLMFITSNNTSQKKLGKWWKRLHRLVYVVLWLLVFHTGLQRISIWSIFIGIFALLEIISWIYYLFNKRVVVSSQTVS